MALLALLLLASCGEDGHHFKIEGRLLQMNSGEFYVYSTDGDINGFDTIKVEGGRFAFEMPCERAMTLTIIFPNFSQIPIFAEPGKTVTIKGDASHLKALKIKGTKTNELMSSFRERIANASPPEIKQYAAQFIADHQMDFIQFKTQLLLRGETDPTKRAAAVSSIVESISVIQNQILRDTYIHECAEQTGVAEQTLISSMNRIIYADKQKATPQEQQGQSAPAPQTATRRQATYQMRGQVESRQADIERLLIENVVRHGEEVIMKDLEDESTGKKVSLTVAQYISYDLGLDGLTLSNPLYNTILQEATDHSGEPDFNASRYFTHHSNIEVAQLAATLSMENVKLAKSLAMNIKENTLRDRIIHLVLDFRMEYVKQQLRSLQQKLKEVQSDVDQMMQVMGQIKQLQEIRNVLAHRLGSDVFAN